MATPTSRARRATRAARTRAHRRIVVGERELTRAWRRVESRVGAALASMELDAASRERILAMLEREWRREARERRRLIEDTTEGAAREGLAAGPEVGEAAFEQLGLVAPIDSQRAVSIATSHLHGAQAAGGIALSRRLHAHDAATTAAMAEDLATTFRTGRDVRTAAQRLLELDDAQVEIPRYVSDLEDAVSSGDADELRAVVREHTRSVGRLADPELRAAGEQLLRAAERAQADDLRRQVRYWIRDRALYQERVIVRTEGARAFGAAFVESTREQPWTKGYRWNLSPSHPRPDICDLYANQALDGLGPGGYRAESLPAHPAHPNCFCFLTSILDEDHFERELANLRGDPEPARGWEDPNEVTATDWLRTQPEATQLTVLGPARRVVWQREPHRVIGPRGRIAPLWEVQGRGRPVRARGESRAARAADPFGEAGSARPGGDGGGGGPPGGGGGSGGDGSRGSRRPFHERTWEFEGVGRLSASVPTIREAAEIDRVWRASRPQDDPAATWTWEGIRRTHRDCFALRDEAGGVVALFASHHGRSIHVDGGKGYRFDWIEVRHDRRGRRIGEAITALVASRARELGADRLIMQSHPDPRTLAFHARIGAVQRRPRDRTWRGTPGLVPFVLEPARLKELADYADDAEAEVDR